MDARPGAARAAATASTIDAALPIVQRVCRSRLSGRPPADIEDAIQETILQYLKSDRDRIVNVNAWFAAVAVHICAKSLRTRYSKPEETLEDDIGDGDVSDPAEVAVDDLWFESVEKHLHITEARLLRWLYVDRLPYTEIASRLNVTGGHARVLSFRARQHARQVIIGFDFSADGIAS